MTTKNLVSRGEADSVAGHTDGYSLVAANTNVNVVNLAPWSGMYVKLIAQGQAFFYVWGTEADIPNAATYLKAGQQLTLGTLGVADVLPAGAWAFEVPKEEAAVLFFAAASAGGQLTVLRK